MKSSSTMFQMSALQTSLLTLLDGLFTRSLFSKITSNGTKLQDSSKRQRYGSDGLNVPPSLCSVLCANLNVKTILIYFKRLRDVFHSQWCHVLIYFHVFMFSIDVLRSVLMDPRCLWVAWHSDGQQHLPRSLGPSTSFAEKSFKKARTA